VKRAATTSTWHLGILALGASLGLALPLAAQQAPAAAPPPPAPEAARFGIVEYPQRKPASPEAIERGRTLYGVSCRFCHGPDLRGGDGGGPNLLRSTLVLEDDQGEKLGPFLQAGRGSMPPFQFTAAQVSDIAAYLHGFPVSSRTQPSTVSIVVGDAKRGAQFVTEACASCHTTDALRAFTNNPRLADPKTLQQMWLMPGFGGRGAPPIPAPDLRVALTPPQGARVEGKLVRMDDFTVSVELADGTLRTVRTAGTATKVDVIDPLAPHKALLGRYRDADIHDVTAYLMSLRGGR
jgi:cytochrome c oxidase cbb3-type subunit 3